MSFTALLPLISSIGDTGIGDLNGDVHFFSGEENEMMLIGDEYSDRFYPHKYVKLKLNKGITRK